MAKNSSTKTNKKSSKQDIFVSVIVVARNFDDFPNYCHKLSQKLMDSYTNYEIIIVYHAGASSASLASIPMISPLLLVLKERLAIMQWSPIRPSMI